MAACSGTAAEPGTASSARPEGRPGAPTTVAGSVNRVPEKQADELGAVQALFDLAPYDAGTDAVLVRVQEELKRGCMAEQGFDYTVAPPVRREGSDALAILPPVPTTSEIAKLGYAAFADHQQIDTREADTAYAANDAKAAADADYSLALFGDDSADTVGGCTGAALRTVDEATGKRAWELYRSLGPTIEIALGQQNSTDPLLVDAISRWQRCLEADGFTAAPTPFRAQDEFAVAPGDPTDDEIRTATADAQCRTASHVRDEYVRVYGAAASRFFDENSAVVADLRLIETEESTSIRLLATGLGVSLAEA